MKYVSNFLTITLIAFTQPLQTAHLETMANEATVSSNGLFSRRASQLSTAEIKARMQTSAKQKSAQNQSIFENSAGNPRPYDTTSTPEYIDLSKLNTIEPAQETSSNNKQIQLNTSTSINLKNKTTFDPQAPADYQPSYQNEFMLLPAKFYTKALQKQFPDASDQDLLTYTNLYLKEVSGHYEQKRIWNSIFLQNDLEKPIIIKPSDIVIDPKMPANSPLQKLYDSMSHKVDNNKDEPSSSDMQEAALASADRNNLAAEQGTITSEQMANQATQQALYDNLSPEVAKAVIDNTSNIVATVKPLAQHAAILSYQAVTEPGTVAIEAAKTAVSALHENVIKPVVNAAVQGGAEILKEALTAPTDPNAQSILTSKTHEVLGDLYNTGAQTALQGAKTYFTRNGQHTSSEEPSPYDFNKQTQAAAHDFLNTAGEVGAKALRDFTTVNETKLKAEARQVETENATDLANHRAETKALTEAFIAGRPDNATAGNVITKPTTLEFTEQSKDPSAPSIALNFGADGKIASATISYKGQTNIIKPENIKINASTGTYTFDATFKNNDGVVSRAKGAIQDAFIENTILDSLRATFKNAAKNAVDAGYGIDESGLNQALLEAVEKSTLSSANPGENIITVMYDPKTSVVSSELQQSLENGSRITKTLVYGIEPAKQATQQLDMSNSEANLSPVNPTLPRSLSNQLTAIFSKTAQSVKNSPVALNNLIKNVVQSLSQLLSVKLSPGENIEAVKTVTAEVNPKNDPNTNFTQATPKNFNTKFTAWTQKASESFIKFVYQIRGKNETASAEPVVNLAVKAISLKGIPGDLYAPTINMNVNAQGEVVSATLAHHNVRGGYDIPEKSFDSIKFDEKTGVYTMEFTNKQKSTGLDKAVDAVGDAAFLTLINIVEGGHGWKTFQNANPKLANRIVAELKGRIPTRIDNVIVTFDPATNEVKTIVKKQMSDESFITTTLEYPPKAATPQRISSNPVTSVEISRKI